MEKTTALPGLSAPFNHGIVIEGTLLNAFPAVWHGVYYFDPRRGTRPEEESSNVYSLIRAEHSGVHPRSLQTFENQVLAAVRCGRGMTIPLSGGASRIACYVMTEKKSGPNRLRDFFGDAALYDQDLDKIARLFEEYVARHEMFHSVEMLEPQFGTHTKTLAESERGADAYALLSMFRHHGAPVFPFAEKVVAARDHQYERNREYSEYSAQQYLTQTAIRNVIDYVRETGRRTLQALSEADMFTTAQRLGAATSPGPA